MEAFLIKADRYLDNPQIADYLAKRISVISASIPTELTSGIISSQSCLTAVSFPNVTTIKTGAFAGDTHNLVESKMYFPKCTKIESSAFIQTGYNRFSYGDSTSGYLEFPALKSLDSYALMSCNVHNISMRKCVSIGNNAFENCTTLYRVYAPSIKSIGNYAFYSCMNLLSANFSNCESVGYYVFQGCTSLTTIDLRRVNYIPDYAFMDCTKLKSIRLDACTSYGRNSVFANCTALETLSLPSFSIASDLRVSAKTLYLTGVNVEKDNAFANNRYAETIYMSMNNASKIGYRAFASCNKLGHIYGLDYGKIESIGDEAFTYCSALTDITFSNCTTIGNYTFHNCNSLSMINLPKLTSMSSTAFQQCSALETVMLAGMSRTYSGMFSSCPALKRVYLDNCQTLASKTFVDNNLLELLYIPNCTRIENNAFIPKTNDIWPLTNIDMSKLTYFGNLPSNIKLSYIDLPICSQIGCLAYDNSGLSYVNLGASSFELLSSYIAVDCWNVNALKIDNAINISSKMFENFRFKNLTLSKCQSIGSYVFSDLTRGVMTISAPELTTIGSGAFTPNLAGTVANTDLTTLTLPKVTSIGTKAFYGFVNLKTVTLPAVKTIASEAFNAFQRYSEYGGPVEKTYVLGGSTVVDFASNAFGVTVAYNTSTYSTFYDCVNILVPNELLSEYKTKYAGTVYESRIFQLAT